MKKYLVLFVLVFFAVGAQAATAFLKERIDGGPGYYDQCVYESVKGRTVINVRKTAICPTSIEV